MRDPLRLTLVLCVLGACGALGACSREPPHAAHTVAWYLGHRAQRAATVARCTNDPGSYGKTPDCVNALAAAERADVGSLRNLPPMGLMSGKTQSSHGRGTAPRSP